MASAKPSTLCNEKQVDMQVHLVNFDAIRALCVIAVLLTHSFLIVDGQLEPLAAWLGIDAGKLAVFSFLSISGYLIAMSIQNTASISRYLWKRFLRIFPGLMVCAFLVSAVLCTFPLGKPGMSPEQAFAYIKSTALLDVYASATYVKNAYYSSHLGGAINSPIWTIAYESYYYIYAALLASVGLLKPLAAFLLIPISIFWMKAGLLFNGWLYLLPSFMTGVLAFFLKDVLDTRRRWIISICIFTLCIAAAIGQLKEVYPIFGGIFVIAIGTMRLFRLPNTAFAGDFTYGAYLYGWPIQQLLYAHIPWCKNVGIHFVLSVTLSILAGLLSWHLIEKRFLRLKTADASFNWLRRPSR